MLTFALWLQTSYSGTGSIHTQVGGLVVRVSFSNLFKEFKATSTWLQFPFVDITPRWTLLVLDLNALLRMYVEYLEVFVEGRRGRRGEEGVLSWLCVASGWFKMLIGCVLCLCLANPCSAGRCGIGGGGGAGGGGETGPVCGCVVVGTFVLRSVDTNKQQLLAHLVTYTDDAAPPRAPGITPRYVNRQFLYIKGLRLCANMFVRNAFASCNNYDERNLPRAMEMFHPKDTSWHDIYDCIRFPFVLDTHEGLQNSLAPGNGTVRVCLPCVVHVHVCASVPVHCVLVAPCIHASIFL